MTTMATRVAVACAMAMALVGCSPASQGAGVDERTQQNEALDTHVESERAAIPTILEASSGVYSEITVNAIHPDTVEFSYVYADQLDPAVTKDYFDTMTPTVRTLCDTVVFPAMASAGVVGSQKATYAFYNADGSLLWSDTFESS